MPKKAKSLGKPNQSQQSGGSRQAIVGVTASYEGPIPHPEHLAAYERVHPGAADRILRMAENQARHRQQMEKHDLTSGTKIGATSMWLSFAITAGLMLLGAFLVFYNKSTAGYFAIFAPAVFHAANHIYNKRHTPPTA